MFGKRSVWLSLVFFVTLGLVSACSLPGQKPPALEPAATLAPTASPEPAPTATPLPRTLTICLGQEPNTLYPLGQPNPAARSVFGALYDGPLDTFTNGYQAVILEKIPSIENGEAQVAAVAVQRGTLVVDSAGNPTRLDLGVTVFPSGCRETACAVTYDGLSPLEMDQLVVTFRLLPGLTWSDGQPLTAADSLYAYALAADPATPGSKYLIDHTQSYEAVDERTAQWWGLPGFSDTTYADNFWMPLPRHLWEKTSPADLLRADVTVRPPVGWGPYLFKEWVAGEYLLLEKNPAYFRAAEGLPKFDRLTFRFLPDATTALSDLIAGQCDLLDPSLRMESELDLLTSLAENDQVQLLTSTTPLMERLDFGIRPASFEDGYAPGLGDRADLFGDVRTRQGLAYCLDRQKIVQGVFGGLSQVPDTFLSPEHPLYNAETAKYPFDVNRGLALLKEAGWVDPDNDPATPLVAMNVQNVVIGTPLSVTYLTTSASQRKQVSEILASSLAQCGVEVKVQYLTQDELYAAGPAGPLFGRQFDLAEYAVGVAGTEPPCAWFLAEQIPTAANHWLGLNLSGYTNPDYEALCRQARQSLPGQAEYAASFAEVQSIFANDLPSIPLYLRIKAAAARQDFCNFSLEAYTLNDLWNLEELDYGPACQ